MILDKNGKEIRKGDRVRVHQEEEISEAEVVELFPENPTINEKGFWVDIDKGDGVQGMMSYILEVI